MIPYRHAVDPPGEFSAETPPRIANAAPDQNRGFSTLTQPL